MNEVRTKNANALLQKELREVDDFNIFVEDPKRGKMTIFFTLGEYDSVACDLLAASDDMQKLKEWMESIARDEHLASVSLGSGAKLTCELTDIPERAVEKTCRYLDELVPSPIAMLRVTTGNEETYTAVLKVKHFINLLYIALLTGNYDYPGVLRKHWYPYTEKYKQSEDFPKWVRKQPCWHQTLLSSPLLEWYLQASESYTKAKPQFKYDLGCAYLLSMWADYGSCIFWRLRDGASVGVGKGIDNHDLSTDIDINGHIFSFSDLEGLEDWYEEFIGLAYDFDKVDADFPEEIIEEEIADASKLEILQKAREWHIRGFKLAQEIRKRLPLNVILIYQQSWDVGHSLHYFERDKGRIIFDPRKIEKTRQGKSWFLLKDIDNLNPVFPEELSGNAARITGGGELG